MSPTETLEKNIKVRTKKNKTFKKKINKFTLFNLFIIINKGLFFQSKLYIIYLYKLSNLISEKIYIVIIIFFLD